VADNRHRSAYCIVLENEPERAGNEMAKRKLLVEGWRFLPHSYAMVNQWQLLALRRRGDLELRVRDLPLYRSGWRMVSGVMDATAEAALRGLPGPEPGFTPDAVLRLAFPFDFAASAAPRLGLFCTNEFHNFAPDAWVTPPADVAFDRRPDLKILTPSRWSAEGLERIGIPAQKIAVVPHGVDGEVFKPDAARGAAMRERLSIGAGVVFMNVGAMTSNKGLDLLLQAFVALCRQRSDVYLLLKGSDELYRSQAHVGGLLNALEPQWRALIGPRLVYGGTTVSTADMADLYRAADVYVSPYRAEAFNLPVLEAMASGLPVICTAGGPTDEFMNENCGWRIASRRVVSTSRPNGHSVHLQADVGHLVAERADLPGQAEWRRAAGEAGRQQARPYSWERVSDKLLEALL